MTSTLSPTTMTTTMTFPTYPAIPRISLSSTTENSKIVSSTSRKPKMPRVTLKLRENETIPQMYMKAGIASYKKGNITTSVLAHDLSLEGLIFKVPDGTIKPWPHKWFFRDPTFDIPWNKVSVILPDKTLVFNLDRGSFRSIGDLRTVKYFDQV